MHHITPSRRALLVAGVAGLACQALSLPRANRADARKRKPKVQSVTRTFASVVPITVPAVAFATGPATPYPATILVEDFANAVITDVNLTLRAFSHVDVDNVEILLVKGNANAMLLGDVAKTGTQPAVTITLDDQAATGLPETTPMVSGRFQPRNFFLADDIGFTPAPPVSGKQTLSAFNGLAPNGIWQLFVWDEAIGGDGAIAGGWDLEITADVQVKKRKKKKK